MTEKQLAHFKKMLLDEKARVIDDHAESMAGDRAETEEESAGELSDADPNNMADEASNLFDRERERASLDNRDRILGKIERALQKMDEGTYGLSEIDGTPIPIARLEALPYALTTVDQVEIA